MSHLFLPGKCLHEFAQKPSCVVLALHQASGSTPYWGNYAYSRVVEGILANFRNLISVNLECPRLVSSVLQPGFFANPLQRVCFASSCTLICDTGLLEFGSCLCFRQDIRMDFWSSMHVCLCL